MKTVIKCENCKFWQPIFLVAGQGNCSELTRIGKEKKEISPDFISENKNFKQGDLIGASSGIVTGAEYSCPLFKNKHHDHK